MTVRPQAELNEIWNNIKNDTYADIAKQFQGEIAHPRALVEDLVEYVMNIPCFNGGQDLWRRKLPSGDWEIL